MNGSRNGVDKHGDCFFTRRWNLGASMEWSGIQALASEKKFGFAAKRTSWNRHGHFSSPFFYEIQRGKLLDVCLILQYFVSHSKGFNFVKNLFCKKLYNSFIK